ncbi:MAG: Na+/H+ antiporter NhaA [Chlorobiales bacterium]|nr:Na+/H+ antiporter NhaA [Chlorobiales bacterium]
MNPKPESGRREIDETRYKAPLESTFRKLMSPIATFAQNEAAGGIVLIFCLVIAMTVANSGLSQTYEHIIHTKVGFSLGSATIEKSLHHWINDGLMVIFFLVVGLEIKREVMVGELSSLGKAALPVIAAAGGMAAPALIYYALNSTGDLVRGWGIPTATDIAFAVGVLVLLGKRVPSSVVAFLLALAIADDLGAVIVIGLFYTQQLDLSYLAISAVLLGVLVLFNIVGVRAVMPYLLVGVLVWLAFLQSGVHATLAGVLVAMTIPVRPKYHPVKFSQDIRYLIDRFDAQPPVNSRYAWSAFSSQKQAAIIEEIEIAADAAASPLRKLEHALQPLSAFFIIPLFALANAGVELHLDNLSLLLEDSVTHGVMFGLVVGKFIGIFSATWISVKLKIGNLPRGATFKHIIGVGLLGGIGFTMSMFVTELAFSGMEEQLVAAKMGILLASAIAGVLGYSWMRFFVKPQNQDADQYVTDEKGELVGEAS